MFKIRNLFFPRTKFTIDILAGISDKGASSTMDIWRATDSYATLPKTSIAKVINNLRRLERLHYISHKLLPNSSDPAHSGRDKKVYELTDEGRRLLNEMRPTSA